MALHAEDLKNRRPKRGTLWYTNGTERLQAPSLLYQNDVSRKTRNRRAKESMMKRNRVIAGAMAQPHFVLPHVAPPEAAPSGTPSANAQPSAGAVCIAADSCGFSRGFPACGGKHGGRAGGRSRLLGADGVQGGIAESEYADGAFPDMPCRTCPRAWKRLPSALQADGMEPACISRR